MPEKPQPLRAGVGKYIAQKHLDPPRGSLSASLPADDAPRPPAKKLKGGSSFGDFSSW